MTTTIKLGPITLESLEKAINNNNQNQTQPYPLICNTVFDKTAIPRVALKSKKKL